MPKERYPETQNGKKFPPVYPGTNDLTAYNSKHICPHIHSQHSAINEKQQSIRRLTKRHKLRASERAIICNMGNFTVKKAHACPRTSRRNEQSFTAIMLPVTDCIDLDVFRIQQIEVRHRRWTPQVALFCDGSKSFRRQVNGPSATEGAPRRQERRHLHNMKGDVRGRSSCIEQQVGRPPRGFSLQAVLLQVWRPSYSRPTVLSREMPVE